MTDELQVAPDALRRVAVAIIRAAGSEADEAAIVADHLVEANLRGHDSHGVGMLPNYVENLLAGHLVPNTPVRVIEDGGAYLRLAGDLGYGQRVGREAMALAIERARRDGLCALALVDSHHLGRIGSYGEQAAAAGFASVHFVNAVDHDPLVAPHGGVQARLGTNPFCVAFPGGDERPPTILDMATSTLSFGKVRVAMNEGVAVPDGVLLDAAGRETTDPAVMFASPAGALLPIGGYKGYGLALACELLGGVLTGGGSIQPGNVRHGGIVNHMLAFVVDPARFGDPGWLRREVDALIAYAVGSPPRTEGEPVLQPGAPERQSLERRRAGIPVDAETWRELLAAAASVGVDQTQIEAELAR